MNNGLLTGSITLGKTALDIVAAGTGLLDFFKTLLGFGFMTSNSCDSCLFLVLGAVNTVLGRDILLATLVDLLSPGLQVLGMLGVFSALYDLLWVSFAVGPAADLCHELEVELSTVPGLGVLADIIDILTFNLASILGLLAAGLAISDLTKCRLGLGFKELIADLALLFSTCLTPIEFLFLDFVVGNDGSLAAANKGFEACDNVGNLGAVDLESGFFLLLLNPTTC